MFALNGIMIVSGNINSYIFKKNVFICKIDEKNILSVNIFHVLNETAGYIENVNKNTTRLRLTFSSTLHFTIKSIEGSFYAKFLEVYRL